MIEYLYDKMFTAYKDIMSVNEIAEVLGVERHLVYRLIENGEISSLKIGKTYKIPKIILIDFVLKSHDKSWTFEPSCDMMSVSDT